MINLMFHDVYLTSPTESGFADADYKLIRTKFEAIVEHCHNREDIQFTFDDGGISNYKLVAPILEKFGKRGIFFIPTNYIGREGFLCGEQIVDLHQRGHIIGVHSHSHPENMRLLSKQEISEEWASSTRIIRDLLHEDVKYASLPNGYCSKYILESIERAGIECLYTSSPTRHSFKKGRMLLTGRFVVKSEVEMNDIEAIMSSPVYRFKLALKWKLLSIPKVLLGSKYEAIKAKIFKNG